MPIPGDSHKREQRMGRRSNVRSPEWVEALPPSLWYIHNALANKAPTLNYIL
ncbi:MAG: hypothetical protein RBJ76_05765 [Stenomitos frigidus ULC029]